MSDVNSGDIIRVGAVMAWEGVYDIVNVWHMRADLVSGVTWATMAPTLQSYFDDLYDGLEVQLNITMTDNALSVANVTQDTTIGAIDWSPHWVGDESGESTASGVCCFTWGRTYTPRVQIRKYFGVFGEVNMVDGSWHSQVQAACTEVMTYHIAPHDLGSGITLTGVAYNRDTGTSVEAVSADSSAIPAYQRRRKQGRGS